jgi:HSP20 family protein
MNELNTNQTTSDTGATNVSGKSMPLELTPAVDIVESKNGVTLLADMPGINKESLHIDIEKNVLSIKGSINLHTDEKLNATYMDVHAGTYTRQFTLGSELDSNAIEASLNNGVLKLFIPRTEQHKPRKIEVKPG